MKKGWKVFWSVCAACAVTGIILCTISFALGVSIEAIEDRFPNGFSFPVSQIMTFTSDDDDYGQDGKDADIVQGDGMQRYENVRSIDLLVSAGEVEFRTAEKGDTDISVKTKGIDKRLKLKYYMSGDTLVFRTKKNIAGINKAGGVGKIYIYVPEDFRFDEAKLDVGAGTLNISEIRAAELAVDVGAGEASIDHFDADEADLGCGTGKLVAAGDIRTEADLECGIGSIAFTVIGKEDDYNYDISCGIGEIVCGGLTYSGLGCDKEIDNGSSREISIECGIGNVTVNFKQ